MTRAAHRPEFVRRHAIAALVLLCLFPSVAAAQPGEAAAQGSASAVIVEPLAVTAVADLHFGAVAVSDLQPGTVRVPAGSGPASYTGGARAACSEQNDCAAGAALFTVRGEQGRDYDILLPAQVTATARSGGGALFVTGLHSQSRNRPGDNLVGKLDMNGSDDVRIGGTLEIPAGSDPRTYSAQVPIVVSYG